MTNNKYLDETIERQEIFCHNCETYVQFNVDLSVDGKYTLDCPICGHQHFRYVKDGKITERRWDSQNNYRWVTINVNPASITTSASSISFSDNWWDDSSGTSWRFTYGSDSTTSTSW